MYAPLDSRRGPNWGVQVVECRTAAQCCTPHRTAVVDAVETPREVDRLDATHAEAGAVAGSAAPGPGGSPPSPGAV
jgi:hypothetical protein